MLPALLEPSWSPSKSVLITDSPHAPVGKSQKLSPQPVEIRKSNKTYIECYANLATEGILLLNDLYHPDWKVSINGKKGEILTANYLMRGVWLPPGSHTVELAIRNG